MPKSVDVLCIGETMVMVTPAEGGRLRMGTGYLLHAGGAESNVATHLATLGHRAAWAGYLGEDALGELIRDELGAAGVDVSLAKRYADAPTGVYFKDPCPTGTKILYYRAGSAASTMTVDCIDEWSSLAPTAIHLSGITPALSDTCRDLMRELILNRALGDVAISFDVNHRPALWDGRDAAAELLELAQASDIVFVGRDEAQTLWGTGTAHDIRELVDRPGSLVVKDGGDEATSFTPEGVARAAAPAVDVIEPIGAGDAFAAGWLSGMLRGLDQTMRLESGHLLASRVLVSTSDAAPASSEQARVATLRSGTAAGA